MRFAEFLEALEQYNCTQPNYESHESTIDDDERERIEANIARAIAAEDPAKRKAMFDSYKKKKDKKTPHGPPPGRTQSRNKR